VPLSALIVDDEPLAREGLRMLLAEHSAFGEVRMARHGAEAVRMIGSDAPNIVFLDVQMPEMDGFDVVRTIGPQHMPAIVFVTAHDRYAIQAFELNAIDYLLKPVSRERFDETVKRVQIRLESADQTRRALDSLLQSLAAPRKYLARLAIRTAGKTYFVNIDDVDWMRAAENYVQLHVGATRHLVHLPMQSLEESLDPAKFLRIHRSFIVNLSQVKELENAGRGEYVFVLRSGERLQSSRTYYERVKRWIDNPY
jgi:two-component system, LytTR family, response regulator